VTVAIRHHARRLARGRRRFYLFLGVIVIAKCVMRPPRVGCYGIVATFWWLLTPVGIRHSNGLIWTRLVDQDALFFAGTHYLCCFPLSERFFGVMSGTGIDRCGYKTCSRTRRGCVVVHCCVRYPSVEFSCQNSCLAIEEDHDPRASQGCRGAQHSPLAIDS